MISRILQFTKRIISANQSTVAFLLLFTFAFGIITTNALFNQSGRHPQPLWVPNGKLATHTISQHKNSTKKYSVRVRKVKTTQFQPVKVPIPKMRPAIQAPNQPKPKLLLENSKVDTTQIQRLLQKLGFYTGPLDGLTGPKTKLAVQKFENSKYLPESGDITPSLLLLLETAVERKSKNTLNELIGKNSFPKKLANLSKLEIGELNSGIRNKINPAVVTRIQVGLINFGNRQVKIDGVMGARTKLAIEQFQKRFNLKVTGSPSMALIRKLESVGALTRG